MRDEKKKDEWRDRINNNKHKFYTSDVQIIAA
jgi:hypothetical protein